MVFMVVSSLSPLCAALVFMIWTPVSYWRLHVIVYHGPVMLWLSLACHCVLFACCGAHVAPHGFVQHGLFAVHNSLLSFYFELSPRHYLHTQVGGDALLSLPACANYPRDSIQ